MNWIEREVRAVVTKQLVTAGIVLAIVALALLVQARYIANFFQGPYAIGREELAAAPNAESLERYWVTVEADAILATTHQEISVKKKRGTERSRKVSATYYVARMGDRLLLVKAHRDVPTTSLQGTLKPISRKADQAFFDIPEAAKNRAVFYPMLLETGDFKSIGEIGFSGAAIVAAIALGFGLMAWLRFNDPRSHPAAKQAAAWGKGSIGMVSSQIENQLKAPDVVKMGSHVLTKDYLVTRGFFCFSLRRTDDVLWIFKKVTQNKVYYVIPAGKTVAAKIHFPKETLTINGKEDKVDALLAKLAADKPWIIVGHSDEVEKRYRKNRAEVVAEVAKKKAETRGSGMIS